MEPARLLLEHVYGVVVFHVKSCRRVRLVDGLAVKPEPHVLDAEPRSVAVRCHQFPQGRLFFYLEVHNAPVLTDDFEVDVLVVGFDILEFSEIKKGENLARKATRDLLPLQISSKLRLFKT